MKPLLALVVAAVVILHQDFWFWDNRTLVFGFLPVGLVYHLGYSVLAAATLWVLVRFAWPRHLEEDEPPSP